MMQEENRVIRSSETHEVSVDSSRDSIMRPILKPQEKAFEVRPIQDLFNG